MIKTNHNASVRNEPYLTKFSRLTLAIELEPEDYINIRLQKKFSAPKMWVELSRIARREGLEMVDIKTIYKWIRNVKEKQEEQKELENKN